MGLQSVRLLFLVKASFLLRRFFCLPLITKPSLGEKTGDAVEERIDTFHLLGRGTLAGLL